jgi:DegV family protein with EDD domain
MIRILSDSTCDLSPELVERYGIGIIPLYVHLGDKEYRDGVDIDPLQIFDWSDANGTTPKTAAPSVGDMEDFFDTESGDEYIVFTISSSMSSAYYCLSF